MALGRFGGRAARIRTYGMSGGGGGDPVSDALGDSERLTLPSTEGMPAASQQVMVAMRGISHNLVFSSSDADTVAWATGTITLSDATSYSITGSNTGNMAALTYIYLDTDTSATALQTSTTYSDAVGNNKYLIAVAQNATTAASYIVVSGNGAFGGELIVNASMISNLLITAAQIANATITSGKTKIGLHSVSHNLAFSATDFNTVAWASGTITNSAGTNYSITGSNTGNMTDPTYIYLDTDVSTTALQTTTTYSTAVGDNKILIAIAEDTADTAAAAFFHVFDGIGGISINADHIAALSITASLISSLTITASQIANLTINAGKFDIDEVAWSNFLTAGGFESWSAGTSAVPDFWTLTGAGSSAARNATNVKGLGIYAADFTAALNTATDLAQSITVSATQNATLRSKAVTFTCQVKAGAASRVSLKIDDGVGTTSSSNHTGGATYELLSVTRTLNASATKCECSIEVSSGASITVTVDDAMLVLADTPTSFALNFLDKALAISNYQNATPTNFGDQGVWRAEIGLTTLTGNTAVKKVGTSVTFATAFRTIRAIFVMRPGGIGLGGKPVVVPFGDNFTTTGFDVSAATADDAVFADTTTADFNWMVIGQV